VGGILPFLDVYHLRELPEKKGDCPADVGDVNGNERPVQYEHAQAE
jgi:hypothetical protein